MSSASIITGRDGGVGLAVEIQIFFLFDQHFGGVIGFPEIGPAVAVGVFLHPGQFALVVEKPDLGRAVGIVVLFGAYGLLGLVIKPGQRQTAVDLVL